MAFLFDSVQFSHSGLLFGLPLLELNLKLGMDLDQDLDWTEFVIGPGQ